MSDEESNDQLVAARRRLKLTEQLVVHYRDFFDDIKAIALALLDESDREISVADGGYSPVAEVRTEIVTRLLVAMQTVTDKIVEEADK